MNARYTLSIMVLIAFIVACGCTGAPTATPSGSGTSATTTAPPTGAGLVPAPTDVVPDYNTVTVDVGEKEYNGIIPVIFRGGKGLIHIRKIDVKMTRNDGSVVTAVVGTKIGDEVELEGTRGEPGLQGLGDRVEVRVTMDNGQTYKVADVLREYRTRL
jgi:hypothetical protein